MGKLKEAVLDLYRSDNTLIAADIAKKVYTDQNLDRNYDSWSRVVRKWVSKERGKREVTSTKSPVFNTDNINYTGTPYNGSVLKEYAMSVIESKGHYDLLIESDAHGWFCDLRAQRVINKILQDNSFDEVNMNGDMIDFPYISSHTQRLYEDGILSGYSEIKEVEYTRDQILKPKRLSTDAKLRFRLGNHDFRVTKPHLLGKSQLAKLAILYKHFETTKLNEMLGLNELSIEYDDSDICSYFNVFDVTHGLSLAKNAPEQNLNQYMCSGSSGHTHRLGCKYLTTRKGAVAWFESGCTRLIEQVEYFPTGIIPQWQQGFVHVRFYLHNGKVKFSGQQYFINDGICFYNGKIYDGNK